VGEVVGGKDDGGSGATLGKRMFEGKEYDYLFDIDINGMPLKLPFNSGDDPWMTAQQWIWKNDIDQMHLDAVAKHLIDNTPGNTPNVGYGNVDPFTSGGACACRLVQPQRRASTLPLSLLLRDRSLLPPPAARSPGVRAGVSAS
jgi:hypothetical protein